MDELHRLLSYEEIRQLACRYALALDMRDIRTLVGLFVEDVRVGPDQVGREALQADFERQLAAIGVTILFVCNHVIELDDEDHAHGIVYSRAEIQEKDRWIHQAIQYRDRYERRGEHWYFVRRKHLLWYGAEAGQNPLELPPANWPQHSTGRGTLPESEATWREFWQGKQS